VRGWARQEEFGLRNKQRLQRTLVSIVAIVVLAGSLALTASFVPRPKPEPDWTIPIEETSPDGTMLLIAGGNDGLIKIEIRDEWNRTLFEDQTSIPSTEWWNIEWMSNSRIHLASRVIGDLYWEQLPGGPWRLVPRAVV
jgi:hypothetical protein